MTGPDPADGDGCRPVIACHAARCDLVVSGNADAELHWSPFAGDAADPHRVADLAAALLSGQPATGPRTENGGTVYATDDGGLTWYRGYRDEYAETARHPEFRTRLPNPSAVARAIAGTVSRALSTGLSHDVPAAAC